jgi:hypothetical protein
MVRSIAARHNVTFWTFEFHVRHTSRLTMSVAQVDAAPWRGEVSVVDPIALVMCGVGIATARQVFQYVHNLVNEVVRRAFDQAQGETVVVVLPAAPEGCVVQKCLTDGTELTIQCLQRSVSAAAASMVSQMEDE